MIVLKIMLFVFVLIFCGYLLDMLFSYSFNETLDKSSKNLDKLERTLDSFDKLDKNLFDNY